jgi:hypothetical protein
VGEEEVLEVEVVEEEEEVEEEEAPEVEEAPEEVEEEPFRIVPTAPKGPSKVTMALGSAG